jgi:hypothetical protein
MDAPSESLVRRQGITVCYSLTMDGLSAILSRWMYCLLFFSLGYGRASGQQTQLFRQTADNGYCNVAR